MRTVLVIFLAVLFGAFCSDAREIPNAVSPGLCPPWKIYVTTASTGFRNKITKTYGYSFLVTNYCTQTVSNLALNCFNPTNGVFTPNNAIGNLVLPKAGAQECQLRVTLKPGQTYAFTYESKSIPYPGGTSPWSLVVVNYNLK